MSVRPLEADIHQGDGYVSFAPQRKSPRSLDHLATIPKDGPVTGSHPSLGTQRFETRVASGSITVPNKVVGPAAAIHTQTQIEDSDHNTKMYRRPQPHTPGSF